MCYVFLNENKASTYTYRLAFDENTHLSENCVTDENTPSERMILLNAK